jgi:hypothetical protein
MIYDSVQNDQVEMNDNTRKKKIVCLISIQPALRSNLFEYKNILKECCTYLCSIEASNIEKKKNRKTKKYRITETKKLKN